VYFRDVAGAAFNIVVTTSDVSWVHEPGGATGFYLVTAVFGGVEYACIDTLSTVPVWSAEMTVPELNTDPTQAGYGWNRTSGTASLYDMRSAGSAQSVDWYVTDFAAGSAGPEYCIASPDITRGSDPGAAGVVPNAAWHVVAIAKVTGAENDPLPAHSTQVYAQYQEIDHTPFLHAVYTEDGYYALVKTRSVNRSTGEVYITGWFQLVRGLRLIKH
jgi:hypothetical protein